MGYTMFLNAYRFGFCLKSWQNYFQKKMTRFNLTECHYNHLFNSRITILHQVNEKDYKIKTVLRAYQFFHIVKQSK